MKHITQRNVLRSMSLHLSKDPGEGDFSTQSTAAKAPRLPCSRRDVEEGRDSCWDRGRGKYLQNGKLPRFDR